MKVFVNILKFLMLPAVVVYPLYFNILGGLAFNAQSQQYFDYEIISRGLAITMQLWSGVMFLSSALFAAAMVFSICKYNVIAIIVDLIAGVLSMLSMTFMFFINKNNEMELLVINPMTDNILFNHIPTLIPFFLILVIAIIQHVRNDHALGPEWKEYKKVCAEHQRLLDEKERRENPQLNNDNKKSRKNKNEKDEENKEEEKAEDKNKKKSKARAS